MAFPTPHLFPIAKVKYAKTPGTGDDPEIIPLRAQTETTRWGSIGVVHCKLRVERRAYLLLNRALHGPCRCTHCIESLRPGRICRDP
jgi:hypothetical protein